MLISRKIREVEIGGNAVNNPIPFGDFSFDFDESQSQLTYRNVNIIVFHNAIQVNLEVTGKVLVDSNGNPLMGPNDTVYCPCPPFCSEGD